MRLALAALHPQAESGAVEEASLGIEKGGAHREVEGVDPIAQHQFAGAAAADDPGRLVELLERRRPSSLLGFERKEMARELAHQVAARNPDRQAEALLRRRTLDP